MSLSTPPLDRSCRFQLVKSDLGYTAYRFHSNHDLLWCSGPHPTEREARRELVLERTQAFIDEEEDGYPPEETSASPSTVEAEAESLDLDDLTVTLAGGEVVPIVFSANACRQPSVEPGDVALVLAGPDSRGGWVVLSPEWGDEEDDNVA